MSVIRDNYLKVRQLTQEACRRSSRDAEAARVLVVSKRWPADVVREVVLEGHTLFGESRLQEAEEKIPQLPANIEWHFIGHIQKNKVRKILELFGTLHSVDSLSLARRINNIAGESGIRPKVFLQVNIASEDSKHGFSPDEIRSRFEEILKLEHLQVLGLMAIPPAVPSPEDSRPQFAALRSLQEELAVANGVELPELSMGMSGDYQIAVEEGSTIVRVGSSIFGPRPR